MNAETKWTPGPWRLHMNFSTRVCAGPKSSDGTDIADMDNMKRAVVSLEEREANARLIAAAPEMAEALRAYVDADSNTGNPALSLTEYDHQMERAHRLAVAALSKAGG